MMIARLLIALRLPPGGCRLVDLRRSLILGAIVLACAAGTAIARPQHKAAVTSYYGDNVPMALRSCNLCHLSEDEIDAMPADALGDAAQPWNAFGLALQKLGAEQIATGAAGPDSIADRLRAVADGDADGDGVSNELEILAGAKPGNAADRPGDDQLIVLRLKLEQFRRGLPTYPWKPTSRITRPEVPARNPSAWSQNPIDAFVADEHARQGLAPRPAASKEAWLRRAYLDVIGLPPSRNELADFLADERPDAHAKVVDRLLSSPQYGERWGRHWMDVWRYSDWAGWGDQVRDSHPHIWRWRDWIVESLQRDKPYSEMIVEMLAADEAKPGDQEALRATGFLVRNFKLLSREQWMLDTVDHTSRAFFGVTFKCAQCHDHKYDPLTHEEYFQFRAIFEPYRVRIDALPGQLDTKKVGLSRVYDANPSAPTLFYLRGDERTPDADRKIVPGVPQFLGGGRLTAEPVILAYSDYYPALRSTAVADLVQQATAAVSEQEANLAKAQQEKLPLELAQAKFAAAQAALASLHGRIAVEQAKFVDPVQDEAAVKTLAQEASLLGRKSELATAEVKLHEARRALDEEAADKKAAAEKKLEEAVKARAAAAEAVRQTSDTYAPLGEIYPKTSSGRRLALAKWLTSRDNPLTARVAANHLWGRHFGRGLVETVDDFGQNGRRPVHPALLDWLATELMEPSSPRADSSARPWSMKHIHRLILLSNTYRQSSSYDAASAARDPDNRYLWRMTPRRLEAEAVRDCVLHIGGSLDLAMGGPELDQHQALKIPRRSIYFRHAAEKQATFLQLFDAAAPSECYQRRDSIIPQQALALVNSELSIKQARKAARLLTKETGDSATAFVEAAFLQVLGRTPNAAERTECEAFLSEQSVRLSQQPGDAATKDLANLDQPNAEPALRARENLVHVLFNHHDFLMLP